MKLVDFFLVRVFLSGVILVLVQGGKGHDDDDDDDHHDDDDDGQPNYCPKANGMFPNKNDCASFYTCVDGDAILQTCAPGLLFDPKNKICNFPNQVKCKNDCPAPNGLFPSQHRCDEFILCTGGKPQRKRCKKGLWFDRNLQVCNFKAQVLCNLPKPSRKYNKDGTKSKPKYKNSDDEEEDDDGSYKPEKRSKNKRRKSSDEEEEEEEDGSYKPEKKSKKVHVGQYVSGANLFTVHGANLKKGHLELAAASVRSVCPKARGLFAYADDCSMFYQCYDGEVLMKTCPPGLLFDQYDSMCAPGREVDCGKRTYEPTRQCPKPNGIFPNKSNCSSFYQCNDGVHHKQECPGGLHYDRKRVKCNFPKVAKCKIDGKKRTTKPPVTEKPKPKKSKYCPKMDGIFPNLANCSTFYFCVDGTAYLQECPQFLVFDSERVECDFPRNVGCKPPPGTISVLRCPSDDGLFRHPTNCSTFFLCKKGRSYEYHCPENLIFDYNSKRCEYSRNIKCPEHYLDRRKHIHNYMKVVQINIHDYVT